MSSVAQSLIDNGSLRLWWKSAWTNSRLSKHTAYLHGFFPGCPRCRQQGFPQCVKENLTLATVAKVWLKDFGSHLSFSSPLSSRDSNSENIYGFTSNQLGWLCGPTAKASTSLINAPRIQEDSTLIKHSIACKQIPSTPNFLQESSKQTTAATGPPNNFKGPYTGKSHRTPKNKSCLAHQSEAIHLRILKR